MAGLIIPFVLRPKYVVVSAHQLGAQCVFYLFSRLGAPWHVLNLDP